mgnify:CR=1 FL=1
MGCHSESRFIGTKNLTFWNTLYVGVRFLTEPALSEVEGFGMTNRTYVAVYNKDGVSPTDFPSIGPKAPNRPASPFVF